ncbi:MAG: hypothetical protein ABI821_14970 [Pseudomonadota bacterium]
MIEITDGFTDIEIGSDVIKAQWRDPLTSNRVATGARVTLSFQRRVALPVEGKVNVRYDLAENGCEREIVGVPRLTHTAGHGADTVYHYRLAYWVAPHALMKFAPPNVRQRTEDDKMTSENFLEASMAG